MASSTVVIRVLLGKPVLFDLVYGVAEHVDRSFQTKTVGRVIFIPNSTFVVESPGGLMVSVLISRSSGPGSSPG